LDENKSLFSIMIYLLAAHGQGIHALMRFFLNRTSEGTFLPYRCVSVLCLFVACALSTSGQTLSYSTYLSDDQSFPIAALPVAVNATGETCALFVNYRAGAKLRSDASVVYSFSNIPVASSPFGGNTTLVAIDSNGNCYLAGNGVINPTAGAFQSTPKSPPDSPSPFVVKLDETGNISFATYLGGSGIDTPTGIAVDNSGNVYLVGVTSSNDFPTLRAHQAALATPPDLFIAVLNPTGTGLVYSTYWGGNGAESTPSIAVDGSENAYITGQTSSKDFPTVSPLQANLMGSSSAFLIKLAQSGTPAYSTYLGIQNTGVGVAADSNGAGYVAGYTTGNPTSPGAFVTKVSSDGSTLMYSVSPWGTDSSLSGIAVDPSGQAYVIGNSSSIPLISPIQTILGTGFIHAFVSVLNGAGSAFTFSTALGENPTMNSVGIDSVPNIYVSGLMAAPSPFPILNAPNGTYFAPNASGNGPPQSFVSKISLGPGTSVSHPDTVDFRAFILQAGRDSGFADVLVANTSAVGNVSITSIGITTGDFTETNNCPTTLVPAATCLVHVTFTPTAGGTRTGSITLTDSAPGSPHVINLTGTGLVPMASLNPTSLTFASQAIGTPSGAQQITLTNAGGANLNISNIGTTGDFSETNNCGAGLDTSVDSNTCQISVTFSPTALGNRTGVLSVSDNAADSPQTVSLSGQGVNPSLGLTVSQGGSNTAIVNAGSSASYALSIGGGGIGGTASLTCTGAPKGSSCGPPTTLNISATKPAIFNVTVSTTSRNMASLGNPQLGYFGAALIFGLVVLPSLRLNKKTSRRYLFLSVVTALLFSSCGGRQNTPQQNPNGTPAGTYNLTVTAAIGSNTQSMNLTLIVQ
jgi:hypothetical protein